MNDEEREANKAAENDNVDAVNGYKHGCANGHLHGTRTGAEACRKPAGK